MSLADATSDLFDTAIGFGVSGTLAGAAGSGLFSAASQLEDSLGAITLAPTWRVPTAYAAGVVPGTACSVLGVDYTVRQARIDPPDGATTTLVLARA